MNMFSPLRLAAFRIIALLAVALPGVHAAPFSFPKRGAAAALPAWVQTRAAVPHPVWQFATAGRPIITAPVVGRDGTVYAASGDGVLYAVASDGRQRWALRTGITSGEVPPARPAVGADGTTYWNLHGSVVAVSAAGHLRWVFLAAGIGSPVLARGRVLFI